LLARGLVHLEGRKLVVDVGTPGQIVILNGAPRSGKSSIATAIQNTFEEVWMNLGVDRFKPMTPDRYQPGIGLRPGGERPDLEPLIVLMYPSTGSGENPGGLLPLALTGIGVAAIPSGASLRMRARLI